MTIWDAASRTLAVCAAMFLLAELGFQLVAAIYLLMHLTGGTLL